MDQVTYEVVEHDTGWAYRVGAVFSETFATRNEAQQAAEAAARRQQAAGQTELIEYEDADGNWHREVAVGGDRPQTSVQVNDDEPAREAPRRGPDLSRDVGAEEPLPAGPGPR